MKPITHLFCHPARRFYLFAVGLAALLGLVLLINGSLSGTAVHAALPDGPGDPAASGTTGHLAQSADISEFLLAEAASATGPISFLAILSQQANLDAILADPARGNVASAAVENDWLARRTAIYYELTRTAIKSQAPLRAWLDAQDIAYQPYYLLNMLEIQGDAALIEALRYHPDVARLVANPLLDEGASLAAPAEIVTPAPAIFQGVPQATISPAENVAAASPVPGAVSSLAYVQQEVPPQTGIEYTRAPLVWEMGFQGQGLVVASGDTGIEWDHPGLQAKYRGWDAETGTVDHDYHWLDAWRAEDQAATSPTQCAFAEGACDDWGHGTHTLGTIVGDPDPTGPRLIGMAPAAQWIGCRNMRANFGTPAKYTECFQFFLAPYPHDGDPFTDGDPARGAHIINNSWGCPPSEGCDVNSLRDIIETVQSAGIFVVASAGNSGPGCSSVATPPSHHAATFSVGAHNLVGDMAGFSSRGPVLADGSGRLKPELVAPGVSIYSTHRNGNYASLSGTSMAAPHVAGAVALLWSARPDLRGDIGLTRELLVKSATPVLNNTCDGDRPPISPNNTFGYGRLDAYRAVTMALSPWVVGIQVRAAGGEPLAGVAVELEDERTGLIYAATTEADGWARWPSIYHGQYLCRIELSAPDLGSTGISRSPASAFPVDGEGSLTIATCQATQPLPPGDSRLFIPTVQSE